MCISKKISWLSFNLVKFIIVLSHAIRGHLFCSVSTDKTIKKDINKTTPAIIYIVLKINTVVISNIVQVTENE